MEAHCSVVTLMELSGSGVLVVTRDYKKKMDVTKSSVVFLKFSYVLLPHQEPLFSFNSRKEN